MNGSLSIGTAIPTRPDMGPPWVDVVIFDDDLEPIARARVSLEVFGLAALGHRSNVPAEVFVDEATR